MNPLIPAASLRVTQVLYSGLGGHAGVAFALIAGDTERKWSSSLLFVGIEPLAPAYRARSKELRVPHESVLSRKSRPWLSWGEIYRALRRLAPDVVLLHSISSLPAVLPYCLIHRARLIAVEHTSAPLKTKSERLMSSLALAFSRKVVVLTDEYKNSHLSGSLGADWCIQKVTVIPNGVDVLRFSPEPTAATPAPFRIGMAGRFTASKRQDLLVRALHQVMDLRPDVEWELTLAGDGPCLESARQLARTLGVEPRVRFEGHLDELALLDWFRSLDVYAHATEAETLSVSMLQAMAVALPLVGSVAPGVTDLLKNGNEQLGLLVENSAQAFAAAFCELQSSSERRLELGSASRARACRAYSQEAMFCSYNDLMQECLN